MRNFQRINIPRKWLFLLGVAAFVALAFFELFWVWNQAKPPPHKSGHRTGDDSAITRIPKGYSLVPLELSNAESLKNLVSDQALVDLYLPSVSVGKKGRRIARSVRLLRAPLDTNQFGALVQYAQVAELMSINSGFIAVLVNPDSDSNPQNISKQKNELQGIEIEYQNQNSMDSK